MSARKSIRGLTRKRGRMNRENEIKIVWVKGFIDKKGDIIIPVDNKGAFHVIPAPYKDEATWKYDEEVQE